MNSTLIVILIITAITWALLISFLTLTAILASYINSKNIENLKSWKILSEVRIPDKE